MNANPHAIATQATAARPAGTVLDPLLARRFADAEQGFYAAAARLQAEAESVDERIEARTYRPDQTLESEQVSERRVRRWHVHQEILELPAVAPADAGDGGVALTATLRRRVDELATSFRSAGLSFQQFVAALARLAPPDTCVRCLVLDADLASPAVRDAGFTVRRPFPHLPVAELALPPFPAVPLALVQQFGIRCVMPETSFHRGHPPAAADASAGPIAAARWLQVPADAAATLGAGSCVGIMDTGIDRTHPDLAHVSTERCRDFTGADDVSDLDGHGSHCLGILAGSGTGCPDNIGVAPRSDLRVARVFDGQGNATLAGIYGALEWFVAEGVNVASMSLGTSDSPNGRSQLTQACEHVAATYDMILCVAAGNEGPDAGTISPPADGQNLVSVGAVDADGHLASFSSRGSWRPDSPVYGKPTLVGPGVHVVAPRSSLSALPPFGGDARYAALSGTSMACPAIAGVCSLLWSAATAATAKEKKALALHALLGHCRVPESATGTPYDSRQEVGAGVPQVAEALAALGWHAGGDAAATAPSLGNPPSRDAKIADMSSKGRCSWLGLPVAAGWLEGRDFFPCEHTACQSLPDDRLISRLAWDRAHGEAGERRWCRRCLSEAWQAEEARTGRAVLAAQASDVLSRFDAQVAQFVKSGGEVLLPDRSGNPAVKYRPVRRSEPMRTVLAQAPFYVDAQQAPVLAWTKVVLAPVRKTFLGGASNQTVVLALAVRAGPEAVAAALAAPALADLWTQADGAIIGCTSLTDAPPARGLHGACPWHLVTVRRSDGRWCAPEPGNWPSECDGPWRACFALESETERWTRYYRTVLRKARQVGGGSDEIRMVRDADLDELWQPAIVDELNRRFFDGTLNPVLHNGALNCLRLENAWSWLRADAPTTEPRARGTMP